MDGCEEVAKFLTDAAFGSIIAELLPDTLGTHVERQNPSHTFVDFHYDQPPNFLAVNN